MKKLLYASCKRNKNILGLIYYATVFDACVNVFLVVLKELECLLTHARPELEYHSTTLTLTLRNSSNVMTLVTPTSCHVRLVSFGILLVILASPSMTRLSVHTNAVNVHRLMESLNQALLYCFSTMCY